jgi:hypothetical protein
MASSQPVANFLDSHGLKKYQILSKLTSLHVTDHNDVRDQKDKRENAKRPQHPEVIFCNLRVVGPHFISISH